MGLTWSGDPCRSFLLHSRPAASKKIYLDFDGHNTTNSYWNTQNGGPIETPMWSYLGIVSVRRTATNTSGLPAGRPPTKPAISHSHSEAS